MRFWLVIHNGHGASGDHVPQKQKGPGKKIPRAAGR
jgi:hypothetical protein